MGGHGRPEVGAEVVANGIRTNYLQAGSGNPVVLVHGSGPGVTAYANWRLTIPALAERTGYFQSRVAAVRDALGGDGDAEAIYFSIIAMCYWYVAAPQLVRMVFGAVAAEEAKSRYRSHVVATAKATRNGAQAAPPTSPATEPVRA